MVIRHDALLFKIREFFSSRTIFKSKEPNKTPLHSPTKPENTHSSWQHNANYCKKTTETRIGFRQPRKQIFWGNCMSCVPPTTANVVSLIQTNNNEHTNFDGQNWEYLRTLFLRPWIPMLTGIRTLMRHAKQIFCSFSKCTFITLSNVLWMLRNLSCRLFAILLLASTAQKSICRRMKEISEKSVGSASEEIPRKKTIPMKLKIYFGCWHFKWSGLPQRIWDANFSLKRNCAPQIRLRNTTLQPTQKTKSTGGITVTGLSTQPATTTGPTTDNWDLDKAKELPKITDVPVRNCDAVWVPLM